MLFNSIINITIKCEKVFQLTFDGYIECNTLRDKDKLINHESYFDFYTEVYDYNPFIIS